MYFFRKAAEGQKQYAANEVQVWKDCPWREKELQLTLREIGWGGGGKERMPTRKKEKTKRHEN